MPVPAPGYFVFRRAATGHWELVGEANRRPGRTARAARRDAIVDVMARQPHPDEAFVAVLRSEWRIGAEF